MEWCQIKKKKNLPIEFQTGEAWKVFGKWIVDVNESDQYNIETSSYGIQSGHICIVLRGLGFSLYFYELIDDYTKEQYDAFDYIRLLLDRVLVTNQAASYKLRFYLEKFYNWEGEIFPRFFTDFPHDIIAEWSEEIDNEIDEWSKKKFEFEKIDRGKYIESITDPSSIDLLWDIKGCYGMLLSVLNTIKPTLPDNENIEIINDFISKCEHGYFLGFLIERTIKQHENEYKMYDKGIRGKDYLKNKVNKFRKEREKKVILATKEAFQLTEEVKKKLRRMFVLEKI